MVVVNLTLKSILCTAISESLFLRLSSEFKINMVGLKQWNYVVLCLIVWVGRVTCVCRILFEHLVTWPDGNHPGKINRETLIFCRNSHITSWTIRNCDEETLYVWTRSIMFAKSWPMFESELWFSFWSVFCGGWKQWLHCLEGSLNCEEISDCRFCSGFDTNLIYKSNQIIFKSDSDS